MANFITFAVSIFFIVLGLFIFFKGSLTLYWRYRYDRIKTSWIDWYSKTRIVTIYGLDARLIAAVLIAVGIIGLFKSIK
jgi:hypothetical protein